MFTGIVEEAGEVVRRETVPTGTRFTIKSPLCSQGVALGDSIANNGCCLTVTAIDGSLLSFDLLEETLRATNLGSLQPGDPVNLERALRADTRLGGHFVSGHVDTTGVITRWEPEGADYVLEVEIPGDLERYLVAKGSIAIDGISLTVGRIDARKLTVWIIPHTRDVTTLRTRKAGDRVNLEFDLLAKYTEKLINHRGH